MTFDPYVYDSQFLFLNEQEQLQQAYKRAFTAFGTDVAGLQAYIRPEEWDTQKFNKIFGRLMWLENKVNSDVVYEDIVQKLRSFDCCYVRLNTAHSFCNYAGWHNVQPQSSKISQHLALHEHQYSPAADIIEYSDMLPNRDVILSQILTLSESSFVHNRFRTDPHFSAKEISDMYRQWILNEIKAGGSHLHFIKENNKVASFFLYRENISPLPNYTIGFVSLIASSPELKRKNYASALLGHVLHKAKAAGTHYVIANTESNNDKAVSFFSKHHFKVTSHLNEYHLWN